MARFQVVLSEQEVNDLIISNVRKKFNLDRTTKLELTINDDSGVTISSPDEAFEQSSWLDET